MMRATELSVLNNICATPESFQLLVSFCQTGAKPTANSKYTIMQQEAWVKELLGYRVLDVMAQVYGKGVEEGMKDKSLTPLNPKLVSRGRNSRCLSQSTDMYFSEPTTSR